MTPELAHILAKAQALVDAVTFDENGAMVGSEWRGGNGGMGSRSTIMAADALRAELLAWRAPHRARPAHCGLASPSWAKNWMGPSLPSAPRCHANRWP